MAVTHGVPEYWVVDPDADRVAIYRLPSGSPGSARSTGSAGSPGSPGSAGAYGKPTLLETGETVSPGALPALTIDLATLFQR